MTDESIAELQAMLDDRRKDACDRADKLARLRAAEQSARDYIAELTDDQIGSGDDPVGFLVASHRVLANKLTSLSAIVESLGGEERAREIAGKLPRTKDGVLVVPGEDTVWWWNGNNTHLIIEYTVEVGRTCAEGCYDFVDVEDVPYTFSTRALAEAAARDARGA